VVRLLLRVLVEGIMDVERIEVIPWNVDIGMVVYVIASDVNGNTGVEKPMEVGEGHRHREIISGCCTRKYG